MEKCRKAENKKKQMINGYIGTYFSESSKGVYRFAFYPESGELAEPELFYEAKDAKWVSCSEGRLCFPMEEEGKAGTCFLRLENGEIKNEIKILEERHTPCYILQDGGLVYTANYHDGTVMIYGLDDENMHILKRIACGEKAGCHQILLHDSLLLVPCLEQNRIRLFDTEDDYAPAGEIMFPEGSGPRHGVFDKAHKKLYVVSEWSNELFVFKADGRIFSLIQSLPLLPGNVKEAAAAAIRLSRDEHFLYISVRGLNQLITVDLTQEKAAVADSVSSAGVHPRDFIISPDGRFLLIANRQEGGIVCRETEPESGRVKEVRSRITMPEAVSVILEE